MSLRDDLLSIERKLWTGSADAYREHLDERCLVAFTEMAGVSSREEVVATVDGGGPRWQEPTMEVEGLLQPTPDLALITYRAETSKQGAEYRALVTSAYARREGGWKMCFHQQTALES